MLSWTGPDDACSRNIAFCFSRRMVTIHEALSAVEYASKEDIDEITATLESGGFGREEPVEGLIQYLDLDLLKLNIKQLTIAQVAQRKGKSIACMGHHA